MIERVTVFLLSYYDATVYGLSHLPAREIQLVLPALRVDSVASKRREVRMRPSTTHVSVTHVPAIYSRVLDPIAIRSGGPSLNSFYLYSGISDLVSNADCVITIEPHTLYSLQVLRTCLSRGPTLIVTSESSTQMFTSHVPPYSLWAKYVAKRASRLMACTARSLEYLEGLGIQRHRISLNQVHAIDVSEFRPPPRDDSGSPVRVLFVGVLEKHKGLHTLLSAMNEVAKTVSVELIVVGEGSLVTTLSRSWRFRILHYPFLTGREYPDIFRRADVFCLPSQSVRVGDLSLWEEVYGIAPMEAMASGLPIVVTDSGNLPALAGGLNPVVRQGDSGQLASAISALATNPDLRRRIGVANRESMLAQFDPEALRRRWAYTIQTDA